MPASEYFITGQDECCLDCHLPACNDGRDGCMHPMGKWARTQKKTPEQIARNRQTALARYYRNKKKNQISVELKC